MLHILFTHSVINEHLVIENSTTMNIGEQFWAYIQVELLDNIVILFLILWGTAVLFL
jgi:hypothetical protein